MKYWICIILFCLVYEARAQNTFVAGVVTDSNGMYLQNIHVLNRSYELGTVTNVEGQFKIRVRLNDTLEISSIQHIKVVKVVRVEDLNKPLTFVLYNNNQVLSDIILSPGIPFFDTTSVHSGEIDMGLPFKNNLVKRPYVERQYDVLKPKVNFVGLGVSASVLGSFTREFREIKTLRKVKKEVKDVDSFHAYFDKNFYSKTLNISDGQSFLFIEYCLKEEPKLMELMHSNDLYVLINRLKHHSIGFKEQLTD